MSTQGRKRWIPLGAGELSLALQAQRSRKRRTVFLILGTFACVGWFYVIFLSNLFHVSDVQAEGLVTLDQVEVMREVFTILDERGEGAVWRPWSGRNTLFLNEERLKDQLKTRLFVADVTVDKYGRNVLRLKIEERAKRLVLHSHQQYVWVDLQGVVSAELTSDERKHVQARLLGQRISHVDEPPVIKRNLDEFISPGFSVVQAAQSKEWITMSDELVKAGLAYREFEPPDASSTKLHVLAPEGFLVIMDALGPLEGQVKTYTAFIKARPKDIDEAKVEYVDVSVPGRVYVK